MSVYIYIDIYIYMRVCIYIYMCIYIFQGDNIIRKIRNITAFKKKVSLNKLYIFDIYKKDTQS